MEVSWCWCPPAPLQWVPSAAAWYGYTWLLGCTTTVVVMCRQLAASSFIILYLCIKSAYERWWYNVMVTLAHTCCSWRLTWGWEHIWGWHWTWLCPMWNHPGKYPEQISGDAATTTGTRFKEFSPLCEMFSSKYFNNCLWVVLSYPFESTYRLSSKDLSLFKCTKIGKWWHTHNVIFCSYLIQYQIHIYNISKLISVSAGEEIMFSTRK